MARRALPAARRSLTRGARAGLAALTPKQEEKRRKLIEAAARIIGRYGYGGCSIERITSKARVAYGTFYLSFSSQQELFESILPAMSKELLTRVATSLQGAHDFLEVERRGFRAHLTYSVDYPYMNRVLWEAELYAPNAYRQYMGDVINRYTASLKRSKNNGTLIGFEDGELEFIAIMLIGARTQLTRCVAALPSISPDEFETICAIYDKFVANGPGRGAGAAPE